MKPAITCPDMTPLAQRLARRCWPGPVTLVMDDAHPDSLARQLPARGARTTSRRAQTLGLRVPGHQVLLDVLRMLVGPLALTSANRTGGAEAVNAREVLDVLGDDIDLVIDDGPCRFGEPSSVVRDPRQPLRNAARGRRSGKDHAAAFLHDGPLRLHRQHLPQPDGRGHLPAVAGRKARLRDRRAGRPRALVMSAGVAAMLGGRAARGDRGPVEDEGLDLSEHETQPLTEPLVRHADLIFTMTRSHREAILAQWPSAAERTLPALRRRGGHLRPDRRTRRALPAMRLGACARN